MGVVISSSFLRSSTLLPLIVSRLRIPYLEAYRKREEDELLNFIDNFIDLFLDLYVILVGLEARIQERLPACEGILIVKEQKKEQDFHFTSPLNASQKA